MTLFCGGCRLPFRDGSTPKQLLESRQLSQRGTSAMQRGDYAQAEQLFAQATKACPTDCDARKQLAEALWQRGSQDEAIRQLAECCKQTEDPALLARLGEMHLSLTHYEEALRYAEQALDVDPQLPAAWALRGKIRQGATNSPQALADFHRALGLKKDDRELLLEQAESYRRLNKPQRALIALQTLLDTYNAGDEPQQALFLQGLALKSLGRYDDAVDSLVAAGQRGPAQAEICFQLAEAHLAAGRVSEARQAAHDALTLNPQHQLSQTLLERIQVAQRSGPVQR